MNDRMDHVRVWLADGGDYFILEPECWGRLCNALALPASEQDAMFVAEGMGGNAVLIRVSSIIAVQYWSAETIQKYGEWKVAYNGWHEREVPDIEDEDGKEPWQR